ncbi:MAG TPA: VCBS repeat-containing protein [Membranihabitans sp.]|nr:VCBS repeat-containing protein [Membranihabitans sp.]
MDVSSWKSEVVPAMDDISAWMFVLPMDMDGKNGMDLIVGSKRKRGESEDDQAILGWLKCPPNPRNISGWEFFPLSSAGWVMSIDLMDMDDDGFLDILISDRKFSSQTGVRWLKNPGSESPDLYKKWESVMLGVQDGEPMFHTRADLDADGQEEIIVPDLYTGLAILKKNHTHPGGWEEIVIPYPDWTGGRGKAVQCADIDGDGKLEIVLSFEEEGKVASIPYSEYKKNGKYSVIGVKLNPTRNLQGDWAFFKISSLQGRKFDLVNLVDMEGDGDLDVLTNDENEKGDGLGVVWYENPSK